MGYEKSLQDYLTLLSSPEVYPDIASAQFMMTPFIHIISTVLAYIGVIAMMLILLRIGCDVLVMSGMSGILNGGRGESVSGFIEKFSSKDVTKCVGEPIEYIKKEGYKIIIMIAFIGLMISGQMLPLAGTVTASVGAVVSRVASIDPVPYIRNAELKSESLGTIKQRAQRMNVHKLATSYSEQLSNMSAAYNMANKEGISQEEYKTAANAYANSYQLSKFYAESLDKERKEIEKRINEEEGFKPTKDDLNIYNINTKQHNVNFDKRLFDKAENRIGDIHVE